MRHLRIAFSTLVLLALLAMFPPAAHSSHGGPPVPDVTVSLAVVEGGRLISSSVLHVIIQNTSDQHDPKAQNHFDEWNSWGYGNLTVEWTDAKGHIGTVAKVPRVWAGNLPSTTVLQPGEALVRDISLDPKLWQGWPAATGETTLTLKVTYASTGTTKTPQSGDGWIGSVTSREQTVTLWQPTAP